MLQKLTRFLLVVLFVTLSTIAMAHSVTCGVNNNTQCLSGNSFAFTATADYQSYNPTYDWNFGDGSAHSTSQNPTHTYATSGSFTATCTVTWTVDGYVASCNKSVTVYSMPGTPTISAGGTTTFCSGGSVVLTSSSSSNNQWYKDGVAISGATNQTYTATASGSYTVVVTNSNGCSTSSVATTVTVNPIPATPTISGSPTTFCAGGNVVLTSSSASGNQWYKDGVAISGATNQTYTATVAGTYTVVVTTSGCSSAASAGKAVTVNANPSTPTITPSGSSSFCAGGSEVLTSSSSTGNQWYKDGVAISGATNQTLTVTAAGSYTVTVTNGNGCSATSAAATVTVKANSTSTTNASICSGSSYTFNGTSYSAAGTYVAHLTSANGCDSAATLNLTVNANPATPTITPSGASSFCTGGSEVLTSSSSTGNQWYKDGVAISGATNQTLTVTTAGSYTVKVTNGNGCSATSAAAVVTVKPTSSSTTNASICSGSSYTFNGTSYSAAGSYVAHLTSANGCDSAATLNLTVNANPSTPSATVTCGSGNGTGTITVNSPSGAGITYSLDGGSYQSSNTFSSIADGNHTITAKNSSNCTASSTVSVSCTPVCTKPNAGSDATACGAMCMNVTGTSPNTGTWTAQAGNPSGATLGSTASGVAQVCFTASATGSYNFIYTVSGGCTDTMTIVAHPKATVGNYVWSDLNNNGINDEPASAGINGVTVELWNATTNTLVASTTTANNGGNPGYYNFDICNDGDYKVKFPTSNGGFGLTTQTPTAGTDNNSDANTSTGFSPTFTINTNGSGVQVNNPTIDAGYIGCVKPNAGSDATACGAMCMNVTGTNTTAGTWTAQAGNPTGATLGSTTSGVAQVCFTASATGTYNFIYTVGTCTDTMKIVAHPKATVGNYVWSDLNNNGINDEPASAGINGVTVELWNATTNTLVASTTTANNGGNPGYYNFDICNDGDYKVKFPTSNGGFGLTTQTPTAGTDNNSDANTSTGFSPTFTINTNGSGVQVNNPTIDAGYIGCTKPNAGADQTVCANNCMNITGTNTSAGTWTAQSGNPTGATLSSTNSGVAQVCFNSAATGSYNFIYTVGSCTDTMTIVAHQPATVGNYVWNDLNGNGINDEAASAGINGVTVELWNATTNTFITSTTTASNAGNPGYYSFSICNDGDYKVKFPTSVGGNGLTTQTPTAGVDNNSDANTTTGFSPSFTINTGGTGLQVNNPTIDAGYVMPPCVKPNAGADQTVCANNCMNITGTNTNAGTWSAQSGNPTGATLSATNNGVAQVCFNSTATGSYNFIYTVGTCTDTMTIVAHQPATVGNYVWNDLNGNGINDESSSAGIDGVTVQLYNATTNALVATTTTASNAGNPGYYSFKICDDGDYKIKFPTTNGGNVLTTQNPAVGADNNSDADVNTGFTPSFTIVTGGTGLQVNNPTIDAGYVMPPCVKPNAGTDATVCGGNCMNLTGTNTIYGTWSAQAGNPGGATLSSTNGGVAQVCFTTSASGFYNFIYTVGTCTDTVTVVAHTPATVGNYVWADTNKNGLQDEPASLGINGVYVELYKDNGTGTFVQVAAVTTSNDAMGNPGYYNFNICMDGTYKVKLPTNANGGSLTTQNPAAGVDGNSDADTTTGFSPAFSINTTGTGIVKNNTTIDAGYKPGSVTSGGGGGVESKTLGDVIAVRLYGNAVNSTTQVDGVSNGVKFTNSGVVVNGAQDLSLSALIPATVANTDAAFVSTPTDLVNFTNAVEVLAIDYAKSGSTKAVAFGTKTLGDVYTHTKPICDRLKGAELLEVKNVTVNGFNLMAYKVRQRTGEVEYAVNLSAGTAANRSSISLQSNWFTDSYAQDEKLYNFQLWAVSYDMVTSMAKDIVTKLQANGTVNNVTNADLPKAYISKGSRKGTDLTVTVNNNTAATSGYFELHEKANENATTTTRQVAFTVAANGVSNVTIPVRDNYEGDVYVYLNNKLTDLVYLADGTWALDYNKATTTIQQFNITNETPNNLTPNSAEHRLLRNVAVTGVSKDYITVYKTMMGGGLEQNVSAYKSIMFNANATGAASVTVTLVKKSITDWKNQYTYTLALDGNKEYGINLNQFTSKANSNAIDANDITAVNFSFNNSRGVPTNMSINLSKARFAATSIATEVTANAVSIYPNPATGGKFTTGFTSETAQPMVLKVIETSTGKIVKTQFINATKGNNAVAVTLGNEQANGLYIVTLETDGAKYSPAKLMVNKK